MQTRTAIALGLASASFALAAAFGVLTGLCGAMEQGSSTDFETGETESYGPRCVSAFYPLVPVWAAFAVLGGAALWSGRAWPAVVLGSVGLALGAVTGLSSGFFGIGCGALLLAAGLVGTGRGGDDRPAAPT